MTGEIDLTENYLSKICRCENPEPKVSEDAVVTVDLHTFEIPGEVLGTYCKKCGKEIPGFSSSQE